MKLGIVTHFDAAHSLPKYEGKCRSIHGHTYTVEVIVEGEINSETNFVMDYMDIKKVVKEVLEGLDHKYLNEIIEYPSCEKIAGHIKNELLKKLKGVELTSVKLWEGKNQWVMIE